jgi:hypothetical protein
MNHQRVFLTAEWSNLLMLNYAVDPALLQPFVPAGTQLDQHEGKTYISLVGFEFKRTRVLGFAAPFHQDFEEVNLRFYVKRSGRRGVVFIRELVPKYFVAAIARFAFNEKYSCVPMSRRIEARVDGSIAKAEFAWGLGPSRCSMSIETDGASSLAAEGSEEQFITEHYWGYAAQPSGGCLEYEVQHPSWQVWKARHAEFSGNAAHYYGAELAQPLTSRPDSAFLAQGSPVTVYKGTRLDP